MLPEHDFFSGCPAPAFKDNNIAVFLVSDNNFAPYLNVTLASIVANSTPENNYDLLVLDDGLSRRSREKIRVSLEERPNFSLRFLDLTHVFNNIDTAHLNTSIWPRAIYGRLFAQSIFAHYDRIVYLDCDLTVLADLAELFRVDLEDKLIAGARDYVTIANARFCRMQKNYYQQVLGLGPEQMQDYINSGVLVMNLKTMREADLEASFRDLMKTVPKPQLPDQDIINRACRGRIKHLDLSWNVFQFLAEEPEQLAKYSFIPQERKERDIQSARNPRIIHFTGPDRPWRAQERYNEINYHFWRYARLTLYYEQLLIYSTPDYDLLKIFLNRHKLTLRYYRYRLLAALPCQRFKNKYEPKLAALQHRLGRFHRFFG